MKETIDFSGDSVEVIGRLRLPGETVSECVDRLIGNLLAIGYDRSNYEQHFGKQEPNTKKLAIKKKQAR